MVPMALLALTQPNLDFIKRSLRASYPAPVKSAHLSEALAAACGCRTNIALVASLTGADPGWPDLTDASDNRFLARLTELHGRTVEGGELARPTRVLQPNWWLPAGRPGGVITNLVQSPQLPDRVWYRHDARTSNR